MFIRENTFEVTNMEKIKLLVHLVAFLIIVMLMIPAIYAEEENVMIHRKT